MADWKDILHDNGEPLNEEELIDYLNNNLSEEERYALEKKLVDSTFENDAVEGLEKIRRPKNLDEYVQQLNKNLHQQLDTRKKRRLRRKLKDNPWVITTILILLAICIVGYVVVHFYMRGKG
jgi:hypothetical protein